MIRFDADNTFPACDIRELQRIVNSILKPDLIIAEIGSWKGCSASTVAQSIKPQGGNLYCVDHWRGSQCFVKEVEQRDVFAEFRQNMIELDLWDIIHVMYMDSLSAARIFADNSLDMVFIDADHEFECVKADIEAWLPKVKVSGLLCGHDYYPPGHKGVTEAITVALGGDCLISPSTSVWCHTRKESNA